MAIFTDPNKMLNDKMSKLTSGIGGMVEDALGLKQKQEEKKNEDKDKVNNPYRKTYVNDELVIDSSIDEILSGLPIGSMNKAISRNLYGIDARNSFTPVPRSKDSYGFVFFTRPQLNLTSFNIANFRPFLSLLQKQSSSYQRYTRLMLDPRLAYGVDSQMKSPLVNNELAFIPLLSNNIISLSGWPDLTVPVYSSTTGNYNQEYGFVDGVSNHFESYDIDCTFRNMQGNPFIYFFYIWCKYMTLVFEGILNPYIDMVVENEIDYNTRIYRMVMDRTKRYVTSMTSTGASFPLNVPLGSLFDYNRDKPFNEGQSEVSVRFRCYGFTPFEDIIKLEFNQVGAIFNPEIAKLIDHDMRPANFGEKVLRDIGTKAYGAEGVGLVKIPHYSVFMDEMLDQENGFYKLRHYCYPYINLKTNELEWWTKRELFEALVGKERKL